MNCQQGGSLLQSTQWFGRWCAGNILEENNEEMQTINIPEGGAETKQVIQENFLQLRREGNLQIERTPKLHVGWMRKRTQTEVYPGKIHKLPGLRENLTHFQAPVEIIGMASDFSLTMLEARSQRTGGCSPQTPGSSSWSSARLRTGRIFAFDSP